MSLPKPMLTTQTPWQEPQQAHSQSNSLGQAWILPLSAELKVAVGQYELKYLESVTAFIEMPGAPNYCCRMIYWREQLVPVMNVSGLLRCSAAGEEMKPHAILDSEVDPRVETGLAIVAFRAHQGLAYGALSVHEAPQLISVYENMALPLSHLKNDSLALVSQAVISYLQQPVALLSLPRLFSSFPLAGGFSISAGP